MRDFRSDQRARVWVAFALAFTLMLARRADAQRAAGCSDPKRCLIPNNRYTLDLFQGVLLAPIRVTGIAGAYAGYAEGIEGMVANAAAPANREPWSVNWGEFDLSASVSLPLTLFAHDDFDNSGQVDFDYTSFLYITAGAMAQFGPLGLGANAEVQRYSLTGSDQRQTHVTVGKYHALAGFRFLDGQLMLGGGARIATLGIEAPATTLTIAGIAPELGVLVRPNWQSFRVGATFRFPVNAGALTGDERAIDDQGNERAGDLVVPDHVVLPWELEVGLAVQVGPRPLNPEWLDPHVQEAEVERRLERRRDARRRARRAELALIREPAVRTARAIELDAAEAERYAEDEAELASAKTRLRNERRARADNWPREHLLVTAELLVTGAVDQGVSLERFLGQAQRESRGAPSVIGTSGKYVNFSPRFGIEAEPIPTWMRTRFGSYYEPSRFDQPVGRQHFTFGADQRLFETRWFGLSSPPITYKAQASVDFAPRYQSISVGIGVWH
jgi:hypothetical protein